MVQQFNKGDVVKAIDGDRLSEYKYFIQRGVDITKDTLTINDIGNGYIYFFDDANTSGMGFDPETFKKVDDVPSEVIEEPDLYVYPDTPVGTELIVTQDTMSKYGQLVPKGLVCTLHRKAYTPCGGYRYVTSQYGQRYVIDCDHLMIKG